MKSTISTGIKEEDRQKLAQGLSVFLADSYTLYLKTHNFHWNVKGPMFQTLHLMFETHYNELALAVDTIAERIRALGYVAPGTFKEFLKLSSIQEPNGIPSAREMIELLKSDHEAIVRKARDLFALSSQSGDEVTSGLLASRMDVHEKTAWMLRALIEE